MISQRRGILVLSIVIVTISLVLMLLPHTPTKSRELTLIKEADTERAPRVHTLQYWNKNAQQHWSKKDNAPQRKYTKQVEYAKASIVVELNSADPVELKRLNGIGSVRARRIVAYRNLLGGFVDKEQLCEVYGISDSLYQELLPHLELNTDSIQKIAINTATFKQLVHHPYLDKEQVRAILNHRQKGNTFESSTDLADIALLDEKTIEKIKPYLQY